MDLRVCAQTIHLILVIAIRSSELEQQDFGAQQSSSTIQFTAAIERTQQLGDA